MKGNLYLQGALATAALLIVGLVPASASAAELAGAFTHGSGVQFVAQVDYERAILTVDGNGYSVRREFGKGEALALDLFDDKGYPLADGHYNYELQLLPGKAEAERLKASAAENGGRAPDAWTALTGSFAIRGGIMARPDAVEPEEARVIGESTLGGDLAAAPSRARADALDSDSAVSLGAVESRAPAANVAPAERGATPAADADGGAAVEVVARAPESTTDYRQPTSADGSNGRPVGSQPNR